jgi:hypothetical protein
MKFIEKNIRAIATEQSYRQAARIVLDAYINRKYQLGLHEIPDSVEISSSLDELEVMIKEMLENDSFKSDELLYYLNDMFDEDTMQNLIFD